MSKAKEFTYKDGLTVAQLKELLRDAPEVDAKGVPFVVMICGTGPDCYSLPVDLVVIEETERKLPDGTRGKQFTLYQ